MATPDRLVPKILPLELEAVGLTLREFPLFRAALGDAASWRVPGQIGSAVLGQAVLLAGFEPRTVTVAV